MIPYYVVLKIPIKDTKFFIEVGMDYELPFHPNKTDIIDVAGYHCDIERIYIALDGPGPQPVMMYVEATDPFIIGKGHTDEELHRIMQKEWINLKEWHEENDAEIILNDYYMNPNEPFKDEE